MLEHIIHVFSSSMKHLNSYKILTPSQHGFRSKHSCETQLISTIQGISKKLKSGKDQVDIIILDFAKAFDKVPFQRLLLKLNFYGIRDITLQWISSFFTWKNTTAPGGGGACMSVVYRCVNKRTMRKGTFFELGSAQRCHHLG